MQYPSEGNSLTFSVGPNTYLTDSVKAFFWNKTEKAKLPEFLLIYQSYPTYQ